MTKADKRPETIADLPESSTEPVPLAQIELDGHAVNNGLLKAADEFVAFFKILYQDDLVVDFIGNRMTIGRARSAEELAKELKAKQDGWDKTNSEKVAAEKRDKLKIGDKFNLVEDFSSCRLYSTVPCSLEWQHRGKHIEVKDGVVTKVTENTRG
ncbi:hypothetical protein ACFWMR_02245 [Amycolatopsis thailandensis]|uniref:DUF7432 family protein n=1 Tax=Amycolatopsis thailandensis TaxID=589330 RepID=UPI003659FCCE